MRDRQGMNWPRSRGGSCAGDRKRDGEHTHYWDQFRHRTGNSAGTGQGGTPGLCHHAQSGARSATGSSGTSEGLPDLILTMDVDSDQSVARCFKRPAAAEPADRRAGQNNAGVERHGSVEELPMDAFRATMETNYFGALRCIRAAGHAGARYRVHRQCDVGGGQDRIHTAGRLRSFEVCAGGRRARHWPRR